jgi:glyoxylase-like metal-dependent hydrolase (beta-lactamase superfamily II)
MKRLTLLATLIAIGAAGIAAQARQGDAGQPEPLEIEKVKDNLFVIKNGGGNTGVFVTEGGVVVVDTKLANYGAAILEKIRSVTDKPVTMIINTHTHGDHTGSNAEFPATVDIVAQDNTKANMEKMDAFKSDKAQFLPKRTFKDTMSLGAGADQIDLYYFGRGHTSGDALVVFPALRVMHTGDLFAGQALPIMDTNNGGSGVEYPETLRKAATGIKNVDSVIPGHSAVMPWSAFVEYGEFMQWAVEAVQRAAKDGKTEEQAVSAITTPPEKYKTYTTQRAAANVTAIYGEVKK